MVVLSLGFSLLVSLSWLFSLGFALVTNVLLNARHDNVNVNEYRRSNLRLVTRPGLTSCVHLMLYVANYTKTWVDD